MRGWSTSFPEDSIAKHSRISRPNFVSLPFPTGKQIRANREIPVPVLFSREETHAESFSLPSRRNQWFTEFGNNFFSDRIYRYFVDIYVLSRHSQRILKIKTFELHIDRMKNCYHFKVVLLEGAFHVKQDTRLFIILCTRTCYFYHIFSYVSCVGMSVQRKKRCWKSVLVVLKLSTPTYL